MPNVKLNPYILKADKLETQDNKTLIVDKNSTNEQYPSAKAVYGALENVETTIKDKTQNYVLDTSEDLQDFIYKNLLPPFADGVVDMGSFAYEITHNTDGTANIEFTGEVPEGFNGMGLTNSVAPGTYTFSSNIPNACLTISDGTLAYNGDNFTVTDEGQGAMFYPVIDHNMENIWFQLEKGNKATEFTPYGKPRAELNEGDIFLIKEDGTLDYWWDGTNIKPIEAVEPDLTNYYTKEEVDATIESKSQVQIITWGVDD